MPIDVALVDQERLIRGWTKTELARRMGVTVETLRLMYRDGAAYAPVFGKLQAVFEENPPSATALRLARQLTA